MSELSPLELTNGYEGDDQGSEVFHIPAPKLGLWAFLATASLLFALLFSAYFVQMGHMDLSGWRSLPLPWVLWINTFLLLMSSVALQWTWVAVRRGHAAGLRFGLSIAGVLAALFVLGQLEAWRELAAAGVFLATNPTSSFFYLLTALHGLHVVGGLVAWARTMGRAWQGSYSPQSHLGVELCAVYWHFLLLIWLVMFGLIWFT